MEDGFYKNENCTVIISIVIFGFLKYMNTSSGPTRRNIAAKFE